MAAELPGWAREMREVFRSGATSQFVISGNVFDLVPAPGGKNGVEYVSLTQVPHRRDAGAVRRGRAVRPRQGDPGAARRRPLPPLPQGVRHVPGHVVGGAPRRRPRQGGVARPRQPAAARPEARARADRPLPARRDGAHAPGRRQAGRRSAQGGGGLPLRAVRRAGRRGALRLRRGEPDAHPGARLVVRPGGARGVRGHGADHREPRRPQPLAGREPALGEAARRPAHRRRAARLHRVPHPRHRGVRRGERGAARGAGREAGRSVARQRARARAARAVERRSASPAPT